MNIQYQSYGGKYFRPKPEVVTDDEKGLAMIFTPWGKKETTEKDMAVVNDLLTDFAIDDDATSPFEINPALSDKGNKLLSALLALNDSLLNEVNAERLHTGYEVLALQQKNNELTLAQIGLPRVYYKSAGRSYTPIGHHPVCFEHKLTEASTPLPSALIGIEAKPALHVTSLKIHSGDKLRLISHPFPVPEALTEQVDTLPQLAKVISSEDSQRPFWIGEVEIY